MLSLSGFFRRVSRLFQKGDSLGVADPTPHRSELHPAKLSDSDPSETEPLWSVVTDISGVAGDPEDPPVRITSSNAHQFLGKTVSYWYERKVDNVRIFIVGTIMYAGPETVTLQVTNLNLKSLDKKSRGAVRWPYYTRNIWTGSVPQTDRPGEGV